MDSYLDRPLTSEELAEAARLGRGPENQGDVAEALGITQSQVSKAERGDPRYISTVRRMLERTGEFEVVGPLFVIRRR